MSLFWTGCEEPLPPAGEHLYYISGNSQTGYITKVLSDSLQVQITDQYGAHFPGEQVTFTVTSGGGSLSDTLVTTDEDGYAVVYWILGTVQGVQSVEVTAAVTNGSPIVFTATGYPFMDDPRDGTTYSVVTINTQTWMQHNLRYATNGSWLNPANPDSIYGRLYDWNTAMNACPSGWHLPTDNEWTDLQLAIGGTAVGTSMKSRTGWTTSSGNGTNNSGFTVFPTGFYTASSFSGLGSTASFWSSTSFDATNAWRRILDGGGVGITKGYDDMTIGYSCRCLMN
jgi:uncharacterized protein (TIGR02145 family)